MKTAIYINTLPHLLLHSNNFNQAVNTRFNHLNKNYYQKKLNDHIINQLAMNHKKLTSQSPLSLLMKTFH